MISYLIVFLMFIVVNFGMYYLFWRPRNARIYAGWLNEEKKMYDKKEEMALLLTLRGVTIDLINELEGLRGPDKPG